VTKLKYANYTRSLWSNKGRTQNPNGNWYQQNPYPVQNFALAGPRGANEETLAFQSDFNKTASLWGMGHTVLAGVEYYREHVYRYSYDTAGCATTYGQAGWITVNDNNIVRDSCTNGYANLNKTPKSVFSYNSNSYAVYGQDMIELTRGFKVLGGIRNDWLNALYTQPNGTSNGSTPLNNSGVDYSSPSYRAGLLYEPMPNFGNFYLSWSNSFSPTADLYQLSAGSNYPAETSQLTEVGYKGDINDLGLSFRTSLYHQVKNWERNTDLESTASILSQRRSTNGIEFEVTGSITEKWDVFSGLGLMDSRIDTPANPATQSQLVGKAPPNSTPYTFNLWTTYQLPYGWKIGGGVNGMGRRYVYSMSSDSGTGPWNWVAAQATVDGLIQYDAKQYTVRLNAYNLFNTTNYVSLYQNGGFAVPGTYQAFQLGLTYKF
jgi:catecholate siderophore receptor